MRAIAAGAAYFAIVFVIGFILGALRVLLLNPRLGATTALMIELPLLLALSWLVCLHIVARFAIAPNWGDRLLMGASAFALLMAAEFAVGALLLGRTLPQHVASYGQSLAALGLAAQAIFAMLPVIQLVTRGGRDDLK